MSLNIAVRRPRTAPENPSSRPALTAVAAPRARRKPKLAYALTALAGALIIGAAQIGLSLAITQDSFALAALNSQQNELHLRADALQEELTGVSSPQALASNAADLGMVVAGSPSYIRLSDGAVLGAGAGAGAGATSTVNPDGPGAVANALLNPPAATTEKSDADETADTSAQLPPAITDGLPSPTTH